MFETFTLGAPFFLLLIPLFILLNHFKSQDHDSYYMPHISFFKVSKTVKKNHIYTILKWCMILFSIFALSDPMYYKKTQTVKDNATDIVLALDTSGSMSMYGFNPNAYKQTRLDVVKEIVSSFIEKRKNDRIGLVLFGTYSSIASPLSFDKEAQSQIVQGLQIGALGKSTALIDALVSSVILLKKSPSHSKVIIVLSDGEDSSSKTPLTIALKLAKKYDIKIYTIIIDESHSDIMQIFAKSSQTTAYTPKTKEDLQAVYTNIDSLEKSKLTYGTINIPQHIYSYFLFLALLCGLALLFRKNSKVI